MKLIFNPDLSKQAHENTFSRKANKIRYPTTSFDTMLVARTPCQKHLGFYLDEKLNFGQNINEKISKTIRELESLKGFHIRFLPIKSFITVYKFFIRLYLDYFDVIYNQQSNKSFCIKIRGMQSSNSLAITGTIRETSQIKLYTNLGLESLRFRE